MSRKSFNETIRRSIFSKEKKKLSVPSNSNPLDGWDQKILNSTESQMIKSVFGSYSRVVAIAVDEHAPSRKAFEYYLTNIWKKEDLVVFVQCVQPPHLPTVKFGFLGPPVEDWKKIMDEKNRSSKKVEQDFTALCALKKIKNKMSITSTKNVGERLCQVAEDEGATLMICGSKGQGFIFRDSLPDYILKHSTVPVLIVTDHEAGHNRPSVSK